MKKHDEGYTLPMVMVILLVISLVAVTIMTTSMNNMLRQQKFTQQMMAQYEAQGTIEEYIAKIENGIEVEVVFKEGSVSHENNVLKGVLEGSSSDGEVTIECGIKITGTGIEATTDGYKISGKPSVEYVSYEIIKGGAADAD